MANYIRKTLKSICLRYILGHNYYEVQDVKYVHAKTSCLLIALTAGIILITLHVQAVVLCDVISRSCMKNLEPYS